MSFEVEISLNFSIKFNNSLIFSSTKFFLSDFVIEYGKWNKSPKILLVSKIKNVRSGEKLYRLLFLSRIS